MAPQYFCLESPKQVVYNHNPALDSYFEAQIPQKFEDLWGKSLALKNIPGFLGGKSPTYKKIQGFLGEKSLAPKKIFAPQSQNPTSLPVR